MNFADLQISSLLSAEFPIHISNGSLYYYLNDYGIM